VANSTCTALIATIRQRAGRANDTVLITTAFVLAALNEAMLEIVRQSPRLIDLDKSNTTTYRIATWSTTPVAVTAASRAATGIVTMTAAGHSLEVGDICTVADVAGATTDFDGNYEVLSVSGNDITYFQNADAESASTFGTIVQKAAKYTYDISTLNPAFIGGIWLMNGADTRPEGLRYRPLPEFEAMYMPICEQSESEPTEYTRQGNNIIFNCPISRDYAGMKLKIDYTGWATPFASVSATTTCDLLNSDKGLILFSLAEVYDEMALAQPQFETKALKTRAMFQNWLEEYKNFSELQLEELED
jgi:hypothetical protein